MSHDGTFRAALSIVVALSPAVAARRISDHIGAASRLSSEAYRDADTWKGRLFVSLKMGHQGWSSNDGSGKAGALFLSDEGLSVYEDELSRQPRDECERPAFGFREVEMNAKAPCKPSASFSMCTVRTWDEGHSRIPDEDDENAMDDSHDDEEGYDEDAEDGDGDVDDTEVADSGLMMCFGLQGCSDKTCSSGLIPLKVCSPDNAALRTAEHAIDAASLECTQVVSFLPTEISHAANNAMLLDPTSRTEPKKLPKGEFSFSPFRMPGTELATQEVLAGVSASFAKGVTPHSPGKNSRSGAVFFFSHDRTFLAKRIRGAEMQTLWSLTRTGKLGERLLAGSALSPIYLAFRSYRRGGTIVGDEVKDDLLDNWIVMKTESLHPAAKDLLLSFSRVEEFFFDLKPAPMESDRWKALQAFKVEFYRDGFTGTALPYWRGLLANVSKEATYLKTQKIVDYSAFFHGAFFDVYDSPDASQRIERMGAATSLQRGCTFGCRYAHRSPGHRELPARPRADRDFFDITSSFNRAGQLQVWRNSSSKPGKVFDWSSHLSVYNCCCFAIPAGTSESIYSPCVLVSTQTPLQSSSERPDCGNWLGNEWYDYRVTDKLPITNGKCMVSFEGRPWGPGQQASPRLLQIAENLGKPGPELGLPSPPPLLAKCAVACVSLADYLLEMKFFKRLENYFLTAWYGTRKWSYYDRKFNRLMECFSYPGRKGCGTFSSRRKQEIDTSVIERLTDEAIM